MFPALTPEFLAQVLLQYVCLLFSLCVHEAAHAAMAYHCGDSTAKFMGRLTLDPRKHIDPLGTVVLPLLAMLTGIPFLFGWAKPVPFQLRNLNNPRRDPVLIAMAGPASNLLIALTATLLLRIGVLVVGVESPLVLLHSPLGMFLISLIVINLVLVFFNLIPVPPLDGHYVLRFFLPYHLQERLDQIGPFGIIFAILISRSVVSPLVNGLLAVLLTYVVRGVGGFF